MADIDPLRPKQVYKDAMTCAANLNSFTTSFYSALLQKVRFHRGRSREQILHRSLTQEQYFISEKYMETQRSFTGTSRLTCDL